MNSSDPQPMVQIWDILKIVILIVSLLAPFIITYLVIRLKRMKKNLHDRHRTNEGLLEKRIGIFDHIGPKLNDILCFFSYTGNWKKLTPPDVMSLKRELDKQMSSNSPLFSGDLISRYNSFMQVCFVSFTGWEHEEKIKSLYALRQEHQPDWNDDWIPFFDTNNVVDGIMVKERYDALMASFKKELND